MVMPTNRNAQSDCSQTTMMMLTDPNAESDCSHSDTSSVMLPNTVMNQQPLLYYSHTHTHTENQYKLTAMLIVFNTYTHDHMFTHIALVTCFSYSSEGFL